MPDVRIYVCGKFIHYVILSNAKNLVGVDYFLHHVTPRSALARRGSLGI